MVTLGTGKYTYDVSGENWGNVNTVSMRGLGPWYTLVLVNGTRRHRSAMVNLQVAPLGTINQGSQAVDFATFPSAAIKRVEILRDGASAQYGSDAIAGVMNFLLKDASSGGSVEVRTGLWRTVEAPLDAAAALAAGDAAGFSNAIGLRMKPPAKPAPEKAKAPERAEEPHEDADTRSALQKLVDRFR